MFGELLESITGKVEGTLGAVVMGMDGISVEKCFPGGSANIESLAAEYTPLLRACRRHLKILVRAFKRVDCLYRLKHHCNRMITRIFLMLLLNKDSNIGRASLSSGKRNRH
jgi:predicted regulator of Ras-like GTPase activity (Roadblock/LC7/MglB family)